MKRKLKLEITKIRRQFLSLPGARLSVHCPACGREVEMLARAEAAEILEVEGEMLDALICAGRVHAIETVSGSTKICKDSLFVRTQAAKAKLILND